MSKRTTLTILAVVFFGPVIAAYVWYFHFGDIQPATVNRGDLVEPAVSLTDLSISYVESDRTDYPFSGEWSVVHTLRSDCDAACASSLHTTRQVWRRLNKDMPRVHRFLLLPSTASVPPVLEEHPDLVVLRGEPAVFERFSEAAGAGRIYLVDPFGNLMMSYPKPLEPELLYKDLQRLLKYSQADSVQ